MDLQFSAVVEQLDPGWCPECGSAVALCGHLLSLGNPNRSAAGQFATADDSAATKLASLKTTSPNRKAIPFPIAPDALADKVIRATDYRSGGVVRVPIGKLVATQNTVQPSIVQRYIDSPAAAPPAGVEHEGQVLIGDGHHRATAEWAKGAKDLDVYVYQVDRARFEKPPAYRSALDDMLTPLARKLSFVEGALNLGNPHHGEGGRFSDSDAASHEKYIRSLPADERQALQSYATGGYGKAQAMNRALRKGTETPEIRSIKRSIANAPTLSKDVTVYRGLANASADQFSSGTVLTFKGFQSATLDLSTAAEFTVVPGRTAAGSTDKQLKKSTGGVLLEVRAKHGLYLGEYGLGSGEKGGTAQHFLMDEGAFRVTGTAERTIPGYTYEDMVVEGHGASTRSYFKNVKVPSRRVKVIRVEQVWKRKK